MPRLDPATRAMRLATIAAMLARGEEWEAIGAALAVNPKHLAAWYRRVTGTGGPARIVGRRVEFRRNPNATMRPCMCCERPFPSDGPHNRLCDYCGTRSVSPYTPGGAGDAGRHVWARRS